MYKVRATYLPRPDLHFDLDYYFRVHVPLAQQESKGHLNVLKIEVETHSTRLLAPGDQLSPCVFCIYFADEAEVEKFRAFMRSAGTDPMRADVERYTNCELEWTVCQVREFAASDPESSSPSGSSS